MRITIHKGKHRASPLYWLRWFPILINPKRLVRRVIFTDDSKYTLDKGEQEDHNKLFGLSFLKPHRNSARFGWRWNPDKKKFILSAYCYLNGVRHMYDLCDCSAYHFYTCEIIITDLDYLFRVTNDKGGTVAMEAISKGHKKTFALLLGTYFGGNQSAPRDLKFQLKKIKRNGN